MALQIAHVLRIKVDIGIRRARSAYPTIFERKQLDHVRSVVVLSGCIIAQGFEKLLVRLFFFPRRPCAYVWVQAGPRYAEHDVREQGWWTFGRLRPKRHIDGWAVIQGQIRK